MPNLLQEESLLPHSTTTTFMYSTLNRVTWINNTAWYIPLWLVRMLRLSGKVPCMSTLNQGLDLPLDLPWVSYMRSNRSGTRYCGEGEYCCSSQSVRYKHFNDELAKILELLKVIMFIIILLYADICSSIVKLLYSTHKTCLTWNPIWLCQFDHDLDF